MVEQSVLALGLGLTGVTQTLAAAEPAVMIAVIAGIGGSVLIVVAVIASVRRQRRNKAAAMERTCAELGLRGEEPTPETCPAAYADLPGVKADGKFERVMSGRVAGRELAIVDYSHQEGFVMVGNVPVPNIVQLSIYATPAPGWPELHIEERGWWSRRRVRRGREEGWLSGFADFDERFKVTTTNSGFAQRLLSLTMREFLLRGRDEKWRVAEGRLWLLCKGALSARKLPATLERLAQFWSATPRGLCVPV